MNRSLRRAVPVLGAFALAAVVAPVQAQQQTAQAATCEVDQNKPSSLATAAFTITRVQSQTDTAVKHKALRETISKVHGDAKAAKDNPVGTAYTLGQAYAMLAQDVGLANHATRSGVGLPGNAAEPVDLLRLVDSTLKVVETAKPGCAETMGQLRQFAWLSTMNTALGALNAQKVDSAAFYAERSLVAYTKSPLAYYVLSVAAQQQGDMTKAATYWPRIIEHTEGDTSQTARELRSSTMYNMAVTSAQDVEKLQGAAKQARAREAAQAMRAYLAAYPTSENAPRMQASLAAVLAASGDSAAMASVYADQLANPGNYTDLALTQAGVIAAQASKHADAAKLFTAALEKNRYQRDALNNLAATYLQMKQYPPMLPIAQRLVEIDPSNPDNYLFMAIAYQGLMNDAKAPAQKKAYTDSLLKYNKLSNDLPVKVTFSEFTRGEGRAILALNVENLAKKAAAAPAARTPAARAAAARAATAAAGPKTVNVQVEFLDQGGTVVDTQQASVGPVAAGETKSARLESAKPGVVAFRYKVQG